MPTAGSSFISFLRRVFKHVLADKVFQQYCRLRKDYFAIIHENFIISARRQFDVLATQQARSRDTGISINGQIVDS